MKLLTEAITEELLRNGQQSVRDSSFDPRPVVKLFTPDAGATWLLGWLDPDDPDRAFGLCDLGLGFPELGWVSIDALAKTQGPLGFSITRDQFFRPSKTLSYFTDEARSVRRIVA